MSEVDTWFESYDNPMKPVVLAVRAIILQADPRMQECIKWKAPTFTFNGNLASFNPRSKKHASLMFHNGAEIPGEFEHLEGDGAKARSMKFTDLDDVAAKRAALETVVRAWCVWKA
jgi:hypothetical protein